MKHVMTESQCLHNFTTGEVLAEKGLMGLSSQHINGCTEVREYLPFSPTDNAGKQGKACIAFCTDCCHKNIKLVNNLH